MFFRLAAASAAATVSPAVTMAGTSTFYVARRASVTMTGAGTLNVVLPNMYFRLAKVSAQTTGGGVSVQMSGHGTMNVTARMMYFRLASVSAVSTNQVFVWDGSQWVGESLPSAVTMTGAATFRITKAISAPSPTIFMVGAATMRINAASKSTPGVVQMRGSSSLLISATPPKTAVVKMVGGGVLSILGSGSTPVTTYMIYAPPTWRNVIPMGGSLQVGIPTSTCVYRLNGVWHNILNPGINNPPVAECDVDPSGTPLFFTRPTEVPTSLFNQLSTVPIGDPSWTPATFTAIT